MSVAREKIVDLEEALKTVEALASRLALPVRTDSLPLLSARGYVLSHTIAADRDQPPFDRSTRDGFAVRSADWNGGHDLRVTGIVRAGAVWTGGALLHGQAVEIMTGAEVPEGADSVGMVEHVVQAGESIRAAPGRSLHVGDNVVKQGSEAQAGASVLEAGTMVGGAEIALAAACGRARVDVYCKPRVAIMSTGDELVELEKVPAAQQIRDSNSYALAALVEAAGGEAVRVPMVPDERDALAARLKTARNCDLIVLTGGVSMGKYDLVEEVLEEAGAEFFFTGVKMQPGKPVVFGRLREDGRYFFGLPGNPISAQVTFHCFVEPFLRALAGAGVTGPRWAQATLTEDVSGKAGLTRLLPCRMDGTLARLVGWQGSGDLAANARANCYAEFRPGVEYRVGEVIRVLLR